MEQSTLKYRDEIGKYFNELGFKVGAEIGVAAGDFSLTLCKAIPDLKLYCIDSWCRYEGNPRGGSADRHIRNYETTKERLKDYNAILLKIKSMEAVKFVQEPLDFVFIDGNHNYEYVKEDIEEWSKKVRPGGIVALHDYYHFKDSGVVEAVNEYTFNNRIEFYLIGEMKKRLERKLPVVYWFV